MLSRFLSETRRSGMTAPETTGTAQNGHVGAGSWSDRLAELRRSSADLTRDLPALRPDGSK
jgi:hypothetical protein